MRQLIPILAALCLARAQSYGPEAYTPPVSGPRMGGPVWRPRIGQRVQVILDRRVVRLDPEAPLVPADADIWDVDLFDTSREMISVLHQKGKRVMCYLSVGGSESWRPDFLTIPKSDLGDVMPKWKGERYMNLRSPTVWQLMQSRVRMAYEKGCDALDPDNVDPFNDDFERGGGFTPPLTEADSIDFLRKVSDEAKRYGMSMGMKNAESILPNVTDFIEFAVNEECTTYSTDEDGCWQYEPFLKSGKPVFHFEYVNVDTSLGYPRIQSVYKDWANLSSPEILDYYCFRNNFSFPHMPSADVGALFSTAIKKLDLGGWVMYCDGTYAETPTAQTLGGPDGELDPGWRGKEGTRGKGGKGTVGGKAGNGGGPEMVDQPTWGGAAAPKEPAAGEQAPWGGAAAPTQPAEPEVPQSPWGGEAPREPAPPQGGQMPWGGTATPRQPAPPRWGQLPWGGAPPRQPAPPRWDAGQGAPRPAQGGWGWGAPRGEAGEGDDDGDDRDSLRPWRDPFGGGR